MLWSDLLYMGCFVFVRYLFFLFAIPKNSLSSSQTCVLWMTSNYHWRVPISPMAAETALCPHPESLRYHTLPVRRIWVLGSSRVHSTQNHHMELLLTSYKATNDEFPHVGTKLRKALNDWSSSHLAVSSSRSSKLQAAQGRSKPRQALWPLSLIQHLGYY